MGPIGCSISASLLSPLSPMLETDTGALQVLDKSSPLSHTPPLPTLFPQKPSSHSWVQAAHLVTSQEHASPLELGQSHTGSDDRGLFYNAPQM